HALRQKAAAFGFSGARARVAFIGGSLGGLRQVALARALRAELVRLKRRALAERLGVDVRATTQQLQERRLEGRLNGVRRLARLARQRPARRGPGVLVLVGAPLA